MRKCATMLIVLLFGSAGYALAQDQGKDTSSTKPSPGGVSQQSPGYDKGTQEKGEKGSMGQDAQSGSTSSGSMSKDSGMTQGSSGMMRGSKGSKGRMRAHKSEDVREAQQHLKDAGFDPGATDGILGPQTKSALKKFQRDKGIKVTGRLDSATKQALMSGQARGSEPSTGSEPQKGPGQSSPSRSGSSSSSPSGTAPGGSASSSRSTGS